MCVTLPHSGLELKILKRAGAAEPEPEHQDSRFVRSVLQCFTAWRNNEDL